MSMICDRCRTTEQVSCYREFYFCHSCINGLTALRSSYDARLREFVRQLEAERDERLAEFMKPIWRPAGLRWTTDVPTEDGWYWVTIGGYFDMAGWKKRDCFYVVHSNGVLETISVNDEPRISRWAGPIPKPSGEGETP